MKMAERARGSCCAMASFPLSMSVSFLYACLGFQDLGVVEKCVVSLSAVCHFRFSNRSKQKREFIPYFFFYMPVTNNVNHSFFPSLPSYKVILPALLYRSETVVPAYLLAVREVVVAVPCFLSQQFGSIGPKIAKCKTNRKAITALNKVEKHRKENRPTNQQNSCYRKKSKLVKTIHLIFSILTTIGQHNTMIGISFTAFGITALIGNHSPTLAAATTKTKQQRTTKSRFMQGCG